MSTEVDGRLQNAGGTPTTRLTSRESALDCAWRRLALFFMSVNATIVLFQAVLDVYTREILLPRLNVEGPPAWTYDGPETALYLLASCLSCFVAPLFGLFAIAGMFYGLAMGGWKTTFCYFVTLILVGVSFWLECGAWEHFAD